MGGNAGGFGIEEGLLTPGFAVFVWLVVVHIAILVPD
jgi:hypothetical protein